MGASWQSMTIEGTKTQKEVRDLFEKAQDSDRYENGHSYSGGFGMASGITFMPARAGGAFETAQAADEWLQEKAQKWENALAVRFKDDKGAEHWMIGAWCAS